MVNRVNDFNTPAIREEVYRYLFFEEEDMTPEQVAKLDAVYAALTGGVPGVLEEWNKQGNALIQGYTDILYPHISEDHTGGAGGGPSVPDHLHEQGGVAR